MGVFVDPGEVFEAVFFCWLVVGHAVYGKNMMMACGWIHPKFAGWTSGECWMRFTGGT